MARVQIKVLQNRDALVQNAAERFVDSAVEAIRTHGRCHVALSGGTTTKNLYALLATGRYAARIDWLRLLLYVLGLGTPTHPLPEKSYAAWASTYKWDHCYGQDFLYAGPLFTHQFSPVWIDFRGIQDTFMRDKGIDYFENSRRAAYVQQQYAIDNRV